MMSLSFCSLIAKPCSMINGSNRKPCCGRTRFGVIIRSEVNVAPKQRGIPQLSKQGVPLAVQEVVHRQSQIINHCSKPRPLFEPTFLYDAYEMCRNICAEYAKTFYLGRNLAYDGRKTESYMGNLWRTDELVDGPNAGYMSSSVLDRWEDRLHDIFNGQPYDMLDAALTDTVSKFPLDIKPFKDMIQGMRMDTRKARYNNFQELYLYCYYVAGTVGLMTVPIMGIAQESVIPVQSVYDAALYLGVGNQLTNILRDVGEESQGQDSTSTGQKKEFLSSKRPAVGRREKDPDETPRNLTTCHFLGVKIVQMYPKR
ncbi:hypothetical protein JHK82_048943 [Glycine max]|nr:hypothetical protein JHK85_049555 [Glycine max]KAG5090165.1 hypothetical protein JHK82_048943 [Glycine max]KAG5093242.1 hypothetical protein JHK84_048830 [Glycine max]